MKKWIQSYRAQGKEEKVTEGSKSLLLLTDGESRLTQRSFFWDGGTTVIFEEHLMDMLDDREVIEFSNAAEAKAYIVAKMKELRGFHDRYSLRVDIPEQWRIEKEKAPEAAATAQGAEE